MLWEYQNTKFIEDSEAATGCVPATLLKKRLWRRCFPVNFAEFLRTNFLQSTSGQMRLKIIIICFNFTFITIQLISINKITIIKLNN